MSGPIVTQALAADAPALRDALASQLARAMGVGGLRILAMERLPGGAIQENWSLDVEPVEGGTRTGPGSIQRWVLRTDARTSVASSLGRAEEYAVLSVAYGAGVRVPEPLCMVDGDSVLGRPYFVMSRLDGVGAGHRLSRESALVPDALALLRELGTALARLHSVRPPQTALEFLRLPRRSPALDAIEGYRDYLDRLEEPQPVLEWGLRWCERHMPEEGDICLIHRDFRTGNYLVHDGHLSGVLDWEFAAYGDPCEDLGWFTARCWRFAAPDKEAGGLGPLEPLLSAYVEAGGVCFTPAQLRYWQVMAHLRWGIIALQQAQRHLSGRECSLELALSGRMLPELEWEILSLIEEGVA